MPIKIYDCSNSVHRPHHRGGGGPLVNDVMRQLRENAHRCDCVFVDTLNEANVIITNDVFTPEAERSAKPKIKRMDGIFQEPENQERNIPLNRAATIANVVIFISEYAHDTYNKLQPHKPVRSCVALNMADPSVFKKKTHWSAIPKRYVAVATDWNRPEKNISDLLIYAVEHQLPELIIIGTMPQNIWPLPNVSYTGYLHERHIAQVLSKSDVMISTSVNDPAPKTVAQAVAVGLPVIYHNSGGTPELVQTDRFGMDINLPHSQFKRVYSTICDNYLDHDPVAAFEEMLYSYFEEICKLAYRKPIGTHILVGDKQWSS